MFCCGFEPTYGPYYFRCASCLLVAALFRMYIVGQEGLYALKEEKFEDLAFKVQ